MTINVSPTSGKDTTHHLRLVDADDTEVGFICENKKYKASVNPYPTMASQLRQGRGKEADRVPPFEDIALSDFSGGLAMLHHDEDASKYLDGKRIDTSRAGEVIHGGLETYTTGLRDFDESWPGNVSWQSMYSGGTETITTDFTCGASYNANSIVVILKKVGAPTGNITVSLRDAAGDLVSADTTKSLVVGTGCLTDLVSERVEFVFPAVAAITATTAYKVRVAYSGGSATAYVDVAVDGSGDLYYRVLDDTSDFNGIFFELNGGLYFMTQPLDRSASKLYLYGDRGVADANTGALTTLIDASKSAVWTADEWIGGVVKIVAEDGTEEDEPYRTITDNTTTTLTVSPAWKIEHTTETEYVILYPKWKLVQSLGEYCYDVTVAKYFAIFAVDGTGMARYEVREKAGAFLETLYEDGASHATNVLAITSGLKKGSWDSGTLHQVRSNASITYVGEKQLRTYATTDIYGWNVALLPYAKPFNSTTIANSDSYITTGRIWITLSGSVNGDIGHLKLDEPVDISGSRYIGFAIISTGTHSAGDIQFGFADSEGNRKNINLPAIPTANEWVQCSLEISPAPGSTSNSYDPTDITDLYFKTTTAVDSKTFAIERDYPMIRIEPHGDYFSAQHIFPLNTRVTNMIEYAGGSGTTVARPWVFTWRGPWYKEGDEFVKLYLGELSELEHPSNGKGVCVNDVYLYFNVGETIQSYYAGHLKSVGPDVDYGLPEARRGIPISMASYPGRVFAAIDAGSSGTSSVIYRRGHGWHEAYRAWGNERIRKIHAYARADTVDQLFVLEGADILWIPVSINAQTEADYEFTYESILETSRIYGGLRETEKYYHALTLITENLSTTNRYIQVDYRTSENSTWTTIGTNFITSPRQRQALISTNNVTGRWIQFRLRSYTNDRTETPKLVSAVLDSLERLDSANTYSFRIRLKEGYDLDLRDNKETQTGVEKFTQIESWVDDPKPLTMYTTSGFENNKLVFIEPERCQVLYSKIDDKGQEVRIYQLTLIEVA